MNRKTMTYITKQTNYTALVTTCWTRFTLPMSKLSTAWMSEMLQAMLTMKFIKDVKKTVFSVSPILKKSTKFSVTFQCFCITMHRVQFL